MDVVPYARSVYDGEWLKNDWYLSLKIPYRYLFSYPVGFFASIFGFTKTIVVGRIISYAFISIALHILIQTISPKSYSYLFYFAVLMFFQFFGFGLGAGEWMVGGLETKVFAYGFVILSLAAFTGGKYSSGLLFAGLSFSFHLLIGIYHLFCLIPIVVLLGKENKGAYVQVFNRLPIFLISGANGIVSVFYQLFILDGSLNNLGWDIYVNLRVRHHVLPNSLYPLAWYIFTILVMCNLIFLFKSKRHIVKQIASYALFSGTISVIGLCIFFSTGPSHHLKYYFFRLADVMLPLLTLLNIAFFILEFSENFLPFKKVKVKNFILVVMLIISVPLLINHVPRFVDLLNSNETKSMKTRTSDDKNMENWVKKNTAADRTFLVAPSNEYFYINYERSMFVSWKHSPQSNKDILEWHNRLRLLNQGQEVKTNQQVSENFQDLSEKQILDISKKYPNVAYILIDKSRKLKFPVLFVSENYILYEIKHVVNDI